MFKNIKILCVGDIMLEKGYEHPFKHVASTLRKADIVFGNLPTPLSEHDIPNPSKPEGYPVLKADPKAVYGLQYAGFNVLSLANNHIMDFGDKSLFDTMKILDKTGISYAGVGSNEAEARKPLIINQRDVRVALLAYSCSYPATRKNPGCAPIRQSIIKEDVRGAKSLADIVIVSLHHGIEYSDYPIPDHISLAHEIIDSGADLILGHHPHVLQGIEHYNGGTIVYSLGNFIHDMFDKAKKKEAFDNCALSKLGGMTFDPDDMRPSESIIFRCAFTKEGIIDTDAIPIRMNKGYQPVLLIEEDRKRLLERLECLSSDIHNKDMPLWQILTNVNSEENVKSLFKRDPYYIFKNFYKIRSSHLKLVANYVFGNIGRRIKS
jgi:hypothetical protein